MRMRSHALLSVHNISVDTAAAESLEAALAARDPYQHLVFKKISEWKSVFISKIESEILEYVCMVIRSGKVVYYASMSC